MDIISQPLTREAFALYGDVIDLPTEAGRRLPSASS
jgi:ureidoglycolate hydrolase